MRRSNGHILSWGGGGGAGDPRRSSGERGLTLLEILIALMILSIGLTAVLLLFNAGASSHKRAVDATSSSFLAQSVITVWRERVASDPSLKLPMDLHDQLFPGFPQPYRYDLELRPLDRDGVEVFCRVQVKWPQGGKALEESFETVLLRLPTPGRSGGGR